MKREQKHVTYLRLLPGLIRELNKTFNNGLYRNSPTYNRVLVVTQNRDNANLKEISVIEGELSIIAAFAKLNGFTDLERYSRQIIALF